MTETVSQRWAVLLREMARCPWRTPRIRDIATRPLRDSAAVTPTLHLKETDGRRAGRQTNGPGALPRCWTPTLAHRRRVGRWSHRACAFQEGLFGKAGPEAPAPDGGPPSHAASLSVGASGGPLRACTECGHYCTDTPVLHKGVTSYPGLPRGDPEPHMVLGGLGPSTRNPSQDTQSRLAEPVCIHLQPRRFTSTYYGPGPTSGSGNSEGKKTHPDPLRARSPGGSKPLMKQTHNFYMQLQRDHKGEFLQSRERQRLTRVGVGAV